jgi:phosphopantothenoylcysteine decarboxylase/phosphopantothenate--cysteine ligase
MEGCAPALQELLAGLLDSPFILCGTSDQLPFATSQPVRRADDYACRRLVLGVTGAVQAALLPQEAGRLLDFAERIDAVLTRTARRFLTPRALAALGIDVWCDPFDTRVPVPHIHLAAAAELVLVLPATAHAIFRFAHGTCSDLLSLVVSATRAPVVIVPSMNQTMWRHPAIQRNVELLRGYGMYVVEPGPGSSVADGAVRQLGGVGFGLSNANLVSTLQAVLRVSR